MIIKQTSLTWESVDADTAEKLWDKTLMSFSEYTMYQGFNWGEYKKSIGEAVYRFWGKSNAEVTVMMQVIVKRFPFGFVLLWVPGGIVGKLQYLNGEFKEAIKKIIGFRFFVLRAGFERIDNLGDVKLLSVNHWKPAVDTLNSGMTLQLNLNQDIKTRTNLLSSNWRHNLKRADKYNLSIERWSEATGKQLKVLFSTMHDYKNLKLDPSLLLSFDKLKELYGDDLLILKCCDSDGEILAIRACVIFGGSARDFLAASLPVGRKCYASFAVFWKLLDLCHEEKVLLYDLAGIDSENNPGVYHFKKGTGASEVKYLGEWELTNCLPLRRLVNFLVKYRKKS